MGKGGVANDFESPLEQSFVWADNSTAFICNSAPNKTRDNLGVWNFLEAHSKKYDIQKTKYFCLKILNQYIIDLYLI